MRLLTSFSISSIGIDAHQTGKGNRVKAVYMNSPLFFLIFYQLREGFHYQRYFEKIIYFARFRKKWGRKKNCSGTYKQWMKPLLGTYNIGSGSFRLWLKDEGPLLGNPSTGNLNWLNVAFERTPASSRTLRPYWPQNMVTASRKREVRRKKNRKK